MIDLRQFCSREGFRPTITAPFTRAGFTWATDGHILVRVPERIDVPSVDTAPHAEKVLRPFDGVEFKALPDIKWPEVMSQFCQVCEGRGTDHDCPTCTHPCDECRGTGFVIHMQTITINGSIFDVAYIKMIAALPGARFEVSPPKKLEPALFQFDGGVGTLMPMRYAAEGERHLGDLDALAKVGDDQPEVRK